jgi:hypothetical protein
MFYAERAMAPRSPEFRPHRAPWSLAARLTGWYVVSAFALVLIITGGLYLALVNSLARLRMRFCSTKCTFYPTCCRPRSPMRP